MSVLYPLRSDGNTAIGVICPKVRLTPRDIRITVPVRNPLHFTSDWVAANPKPIESNDSKQLCSAMEKPLRSSIDATVSRSKSFGCAGKSTEQTSSLASESEAANSLSLSGTSSMKTSYAPSRLKGYSDFSTATTIAVGASAYADDMRPGEDIDRIPRGAVRQKLKIFGGSASSFSQPESSTSNQRTVPRSAFELLLESKRTSSKELCDCSQTTVHLETTAADSSSARELPETLPSSYVLLRKSQETLSKRRKEEASRSAETRPLRTSSFDADCHEANGRSSSVQGSPQVQRKSDGRTVVHMEGPTCQDPKLPKIASVKAVPTTSLHVDGSFGSTNKEEVICDQPCGGGSPGKPFETSINQVDQRMLVLELNAAKDTNKELALKLAKAERDVHSLRIQLDLLEKTNEAKIASRVADAVAKIKLHDPDKSIENEAINSLKIKTNPDSNGIESVRVKTLEALLHEIEGTGPRPLSPYSIRKNCDRIMDYVKEHGCHLDENENSENERLRSEAKNHPHHITSELVELFKNRRLQAETNEMKKEMICVQQALAESQNLLAELQNPNNHLASEDIESSVLRTGAQSLSQRGDTDSYEKQLSGLREKVLLFQSQLEMKDEEIRRLEQEIGNAHRCNQQLNAKIGSLSPTNGIEARYQEKELKKALKERTSECETLKKKIDKLEREKQQWENQKRVLESKQPIEVQQLQNQKRELTMQLDREQSEKHELFLQINTLIAQVAEANRDAAEQQNNNLLKAENDQLKVQLGSIQSIQAQLSNDVHSLQEELRRKTAEADIARDEAKKKLEFLESEKKGLQENVEELERELQMKSAALQSLMLAKQDKKSSEDSIIIARLNSENSDLKRHLEELNADLKKNEVAEAKSKADKAVLSQENDALKRQLTALEEAMKEREEKLRSTQQELSQKASEIDEQKQQTALLQSMSYDHRKKLSELESSIAEKQSKNEALAGELTSLKATIEDNKSDIEILRLKLEEKQHEVEKFEKRCEDLEKELLQKQENAINENDEKFDVRIHMSEEKVKKLEKEIELWHLEEKELREKLKKQEEKTMEAEHEAKSNGFQVINLQTEIKSLKAQINAQRDIDERVKNLREELKAAGERNTAMAADLERSRLAAHEAEKSSRETIQKREEEMRLVHEKLKAMEKAEEENIRKLADVEAEKEKLLQKSGELESKLVPLSKELEDTRKKYSEVQSSVEALQAENSKLAAKASLEDEVLTLATSLQSARDEISTKQEEIGNLRKQLREAREENDRLSSNETEQIETLHEAIRSANSECRELKERNNQLKAELTALHETSEKKEEKMSEEISQLQKILEEKEAEIRKCQSGLEQKHQKELEEAKDAYKERIQKLRDEMEDLKKKHTAEVEELKNTIRAIEADSPRSTNNHGEEVSRLTKQNFALKGELELYRQNLADEECKSQELQEEIKFLGNESNNLKKQILEMENSINDVELSKSLMVNDLKKQKNLMEELKEAFMRETAALRKESEEVKGESLRRQRESEDLCAEVIKMQLNARSFASEMQKLTAENNRLAKEKSDVTAELNALKETIGKHKGDADSNLALMEVQLETASKRLEDALRENVDFRQREASLRVEISLLKETVNELEAQKNKAFTFQEENSALKNQINNLERKRKVREDEIRSQKEEIAALIMKCTLIEDEKQHALREKATLTSGLDEARENYSVAIADKERLQKRCLSIEDELNNLKTELSDLEMVKSEIERSADEQYKKLAATEAEKQRFQKDASDFGAELERIRMELKDSERNRELSQRETMVLREEVELLKRKSSDHEERKIMIDKEKAGMKVEIELLKEKLTREGEDRIKLQNDVVELTTKVKISDEKLKLFEVERECVLAELNSLKAELESHKKTIANKESSATELQKNIVLLKTELNAVRLDAERTKQSLASSTSDLAEMKVRVDFSEKNIAEKEKTILQMKNEFEKVSEERKKANEVIAEKEKEIESLKEIGEIKDSEFIKLKNDLTKEKESQILLKKELEDAKAKLQKSFEEARLFTAEVSELKNENSRLNGIIEKQNEIVAKKELDDTNYKMEVQNFSIEVSALRSGIEDFKKENAALAEEKNALQKKLDLLNAELSVQKSKCGEFEEEIRRLEEELRRSGQELAALSLKSIEVNKLKESVENSRVKIERLKRSNAELSTELTSLKEASELDRSRKDAMIREIGELQQETGRLLRECAEIPALRRKIAEVEAEAEKLSNELAEEKKKTAEVGHKTEATGSGKEKEVTSLMSSIRASEVGQARTSAATEKTSLEHREDKKRIDELTTVNEELGNNVKNLKNLLEVESKRVETLVSEKKRFESEVQYLKEENDRLTKRCREQKNVEVSESEEKSRLKVTELTAENARLAGELLKERSRTDKDTAKDREELRQEFAKRLKMRDDEWSKKVDEVREEHSKEMERLRQEVARRTKLRDEEWSKKVEEQLQKDSSEIQSLKQKNCELLEERDRLKLDALRTADRMEQDEHRLSKDLYDTKEKLKDVEEENRKLTEKLNETELKLKEHKEDLSRLKQNGISPVPPPRRTHAPSDVSDVSARSATPSNIEEEIRKLKAENEKQHRLIVVLRRKLQGTQPS